MTLDFLLESFLEPLFTTVLRLSFYGTVGCGVILVCALINYARAPRWISMTLWGLVALRLIIPFQFSSAVSLFQFRNLSDLSNQVGQGDYRTALEGSAEFEQAVAAGSPVSANAAGDRVAYYFERENGRIAPAQTAYASFLRIGSRVWLAGMALLWIWASVSYIRLKRRLRFSMKLYRGVYETDAVASPCVVGIIRPQIYLIPDLTEKQRIHILLHERMHIRYLDHIWKIVSFAVISVHWFNPFLWFMYRLFQGELEKACDERVLARLGEDKKEDYSESLLALAAGKKWKKPTLIFFGEDNIKGRIKRILAYKKPLVTVSVVIIILSVALCGIFLTTAETSDDIQQSEQIFDFAADGTSSDTGTNAPEILPEDFNQSEPGSALSDIESAPDDNSGPDRTEVYEELTDSGITFQARWGGIYRIGEDGSEEQIYNSFAGTEPQMRIFENTLYFRTDKTYYDGALDWSDNTIRWIDLNTGKTGDLPFIRESQNIAFFSVYEGLAVIRYSTPDITDTIMLYTDGDTALNGKSIAQLSEAEQQQLGQNTTQAVLQNPRTLVNISHRTRDRNTAYLDIDGNGIAEEIILEPSHDPEAMAYQDEYDPLFYFHLKIGNAGMDSMGENLSNTLWAVTFDGRSILLVLYEDGPSGDPYTHFYRYQNNQIIEAGGIADDIRLCSISPEGIITSAIRQDVVQTDWITVRWQFNDNGILEQIPQEVYDFRNGNWVTLNDELPLHSAVESDETFMVSPQMVRFLQTSADWNWVLVETADGQQGWVQLENFEVVELRKNVMDVFDGLHMAG